MYKKMDAAQRAEQLSQLAYQLDVLEGIMDPVGPYAAGAQLTTADSALFPVRKEVYGNRPEPPLRSPCCL